MVGRQKGDEGRAIGDYQKDRSLCAGAIVLIHLLFNTETFQSFS
jgi:hypothetical protein